MKITIERKVLEQALDALDRPRNAQSWYQRSCDDAQAAKALREALAQPAAQQEHDPFLPTGARIARGMRALAAAQPTEPAKDIGVEQDERVFARIAAMKAQQAPQKTTPSYIDGYNAGMADAKRMAQQEPAHKPLFAEMIAKHPGLREELLLKDAQPAAQPAAQPKGKTNHFEEIYAYLCSTSPNGFADEAFRNVPDSLLPHQFRIELAESKASICTNTTSVSADAGSARGSAKRDGQPVAAAPHPAAQPTEPAGEPVAFVQSLDKPSPRCVTDLKYCTIAEHDNGDHLKYIPLYTRPAVQQELAGEPVAWMPKTWTERYVSGVEAVTCYLRPTTGWVPLYTRPAVPLSDEQIKQVFDNLPSAHEKSWFIRYARAIEAAHKIGGAE